MAIRKGIVSSRASRTGTSNRNFTIDEVIALYRWDDAGGNFADVDYTIGFVVRNSAQFSDDFDHRIRVRFGNSSTYLNQGGANGVRVNQDLDSGFSFIVIGINDDSGGNNEYHLDSSYNVSTFDRFLSEPNLDENTLFGFGADDEIPDFNRHTYMRFDYFISGLWREFGRVTFPTISTSVRPGPIIPTPTRSWVTAFRPSGRVPGFTTVFTPSGRVPGWTTAFTPSGTISRVRRFVTAFTPSGHVRGFVTAFRPSGYAPGWVTAFRPSGTISRVARWVTAFTPSGRVPGYVTAFSPGGILSAFVTAFTPSGNIGNYFRNAFSPGGYIAGFVTAFSPSGYISAFVTAFSPSGTIGALVPPDNLRATVVSTNTIIMRWDPVTDARAYNIHWGKVGGGLSSAATGATTAHIFRSLEHDTEYLFRIQVTLNDGRTSAFSEDVIVRTDRIPEFVTVFSPSGLIDEFITAFSPGGMVPTWVTAFTTPSSEIAAIDKEWVTAFTPAGVVGDAYIPPNIIIRSDGLFFFLDDVDITARVHDADWHLGGPQQRDFGTVFKSGSANIRLKNDDLLINPYKDDVVNPAPGATITIIDKIGNEEIPQWTGWSHGLTAVTLPIGDFINIIGLGSLDWNAQYSDDVFIKQSGTLRTDEVFSALLDDIHWAQNLRGIQQGNVRVFSHQVKGAGITAQGRKRASLSSSTVILALIEGGRAYDNRRAAIVFENHNERPTAAARPGPAPINLLSTDRGHKLIVDGSHSGTAGAAGIVNIIESTNDVYVTAGTNVAIDIDGGLPRSVTIPANSEGAGIRLYAKEAQLGRVEKAFVQSWNNPSFTYTAEGVLTISQGEGFIELLMTNTTNQDGVLTVTALTGNVFQREAGERIAQRRNPSIDLWGPRPVEIPGDAVADLVQYRKMISQLLDNHDGLDAQGKLDQTKRASVNIRLDDSPLALSIRRFADISQYVDFQEPRLFVDTPTRFFIDGVDQTLDEYKVRQATLHLVEARAFARL